MGDVSSFIKQGLQYGEKAIAYDNQATSKSTDATLYENAKSHYLKSIEYFMIAMKYEKNDRVKGEIRGKVHQFMDRVEIIKEWLDKYNKSRKELENSASSATSSFIDAGIEHGKKAIELDKQACQNNKDAELFEQAKDAYITSIEYLLTALKHEQSNEVKETIRKKVSSYMDRAEIMKQWLARYNEAAAQNNDNDEEPPPPDTGSRNIAKPGHKFLNALKFNKRPKE